MHNTPVGLKPPPTPPRGRAGLYFKLEHSSLQAPSPSGELVGAYSLESVATTYSERVPMQNLPPQMPMPELT